MSVRSFQGLKRADYNLIILFKNSGNDAQFTVKVTRALGCKVWDQVHEMFFNLDEFFIPCEIAISSTTKMSLSTRPPTAWCVKKLLQRQVSSEVISKCFETFIIIVPQCAFKVTWHCFTIIFTTSVRRSWVIILCELIFQTLNSLKKRKFQFNELPENCNSSSLSDCPWLICWFIRSR